MCRQGLQGDLRKGSCPAAWSVDRVRLPLDLGLELYPVSSSWENMRSDDGLGEEKRAEQIAGPLVDVFWVK